MHAQDRLIIALDVPELSQAIRLIDQTRDSCRTYKMGLELFLRHGLAGAEKIKAMGVDVFLDLKLHDIPNTVYSAMQQVLSLKPRFITVHASGGPDMLLAARRAVIEAHAPTTVLAVSVLTSLSSQMLGRMKIQPNAAEVAVAWLSPIRGDDKFGAVCSPQEITALKAKFGGQIKLVCPGIRPAQSEQNDQSRIATPREALHSGADFLVIGRPISRAQNPNLAARSIVDEMESAL